MELGLLVVFSFLLGGVLVFGMMQGGRDRSEFSSDNPFTNSPSQSTFVHVSSTKPPTARYVLKVQYDAWGNPYIDGGSKPRIASTAVLRSGGSTDDWVYGTKWKHKSGPPVRFGKKPDDIFGYDS